MTTSPVGTGDVVTSVVSGRSFKVRGVSKRWVTVDVPAPDWVAAIPLNPVTGLPVGYVVEGRS